MANKDTDQRVARQWHVHQMDLVDRGIITGAEYDRRCDTRIRNMGRSAGRVASPLDIC